MSQAWYREGLKFSCTRCGDCCTGDPGFVWLKREEVAEIARFLGIAVEELAKQALRRVGRRVSLRERANGDCVFFSQGCTIYPVRPAQCRSFPFWSENLQSRARWEEAAERCPGMDRGRLYSTEEIARIRAGERDASAT